MSGSRNCTRCGDQMTAYTSPSRPKVRWICRPCDRETVNRKPLTKEQNAQKNRKWNAENREKYLAHKKVENAIKSGRLTRQPCERCGSTERVHAHHDDYSKPMDVMWLCPTHHGERHRELRAIERDRLESAA